MSFYPIFLNIEARSCLVVGGGCVAERKVLALVKAGADVTVISPKLTKALKALVEGDTQKAKTSQKTSKKPQKPAKKPKKDDKTAKIKYIKRDYKFGDAEGYALIISATDNAGVNKLVHSDAFECGVLLNVVDQPGLCDFIVPSVVDRGALKVAVSTSGKSPYFSVALREALEMSLPKTLSSFVDILGAVRIKLLKEGVNSDKKAEIYEAFVDSQMLEWLGEGSKAKINAFLKAKLGPGMTIAQLGVKL
jgi:precorrin-2 dehydrogenase/sirohydrochlorin ferrochelatase